MHTTARRALAAAVCTLLAISPSFAAPAPPRRSPDLTIETPDAHANSALRFASSISASGELIAIGAPTVDDDFRAAGSVILARLASPKVDGPHWSHAIDQVLTSPRGGSDGFGSCIRLHGDVLVVGAPMANGYGEARTYMLSAPDAQGSRRNWVERRPLAPTAASLGGEFAASLAFGGPPSHPMIAAGAHRAAINTGEVHLFDVSDAIGPASSGALKPAQTVLAPAPTPGAWFGTALAANARWLAVSAPGERVGALAGAGSVHVFEFSLDGTAQFRCTVQSPRPVSHGWFGAALAMDHGALLIGEPGGTVAGVCCGRAWLLQLGGLEQGDVDSFGGAVPIDPPLTEPGLGFGHSIAIGPSCVVVGAPGFDGASEDEGAAWLFDRAGSEIEALGGPCPRPMAMFGASATVAIADARPVLAIGHLYAEEESLTPSAGCAIFDLMPSARTTSPASTSIPPLVRRR